MSDAGKREKIWKHYKDTPNFIFWDVYIWEAHPGDPQPKPKTFKERVKNCEMYRSQKNMTMPILIDSMGCPMANGWWKSRPTTFYLIGTNGKLVEVYNFMLGGNYYSESQMYAAIDKALKDINEDTEAPNVTVTKPAGGAVVNIGSDITIEWNATDDHKVVDAALYFSDDNGSTYELIDTLIPNIEDGKYIWKDAPTQSLSKCKIKVLALDNGDNEGEGESGVFSIGPTDIKFTSVDFANKTILTQKGNISKLYIPCDEATSVRVTNVQGKIISSFTTSPNNYWYNIPGNISSGIHFVTIETQRRSIVKQFRFVR